MEIRLPRGDSRNIRLRLKDLYTQEMLNLIEYDEIYFTVKRKTSDPDEMILIAKDTVGNGIVITSPGEGEALVSLTKDDTNLEPRTYKFDIRCIKRDGQGEIVDVVSNYDDPGDFIIGKVVRRGFPEGVVAP